MHTFALVRAVALLCLGLSWFSIQAVTPPNEQARYLAGLDLGGTSLEPLSREEAWLRHAADFQKAWVDVEQRQLGPIRSWMPQQLGFMHADPSPLIYFFSGPDMLYAHAFYPNAQTYVLCGREPVGLVPDVAAMPAGVRAAALANLRKSLNAILSYSFFITADMKNDLTATQLSGTLPVMMLFLVRSSCRIEEVELVKLNANGDLTQDKSKTPGVRVAFTGTTGRRQTLYYFTTDLSNWGIKDNPAFLAFCRKLGQGNALVKAASYLMHLDEFSTARDYLLTQSRNIIQDDSGVPFRFFKPEAWVLSLYGHYPGPIELFQKHNQPDLHAAFTNQKTGDLPFGFGYQWRPGISSLMAGTSMSSVPKATPVAEPVEE